METSVLIARIVGPLFVLVATGILLNRQHYSEMMAKFIRDPALMYFSGVLAFILGVVLVSLHNLWVADWRVAITMIGWLSLTKGVGRIVFPNAAPAVGAKILENSFALNMGAALMLVIGFYLSLISVQ